MATDCQCMGEASCCIRVACGMQSAIGGCSQLCVVQAENEALQQLVLEVAENKQAAQEQVARLREKFANLVAQVSCHAAARADVALSWRDFRHTCCKLHIFTAQIEVCYLLLC